SDDMLCRLVAVVSFGAPAARVVISTREPAAIQRRLLPVIGVLTPGSPGVAPYTETGARFDLEASQFEVLDHRPIEAILREHRAAGHSLSSLLPSAKLGGEPLRVSLLVRASVPASSAIASVVVDRTLEMVGSAPFALCYAALLLRRGVPQLEGALVTVGTAVG